MAESGFERTSESERQFLPPERARWSLWPWFLLLGAVHSANVLPESSPDRGARLLDAVGAGIDTLVSQIPSSNRLGLPHVVQSPVRHSPTKDAFAQGESRSASSPGGCHDADVARDEFN